MQFIIFVVTWVILYSIILRTFRFIGSLVRNAKKRKAEKKFDEENNIVDGECREV